MNTKKKKTSRTKTLLTIGFECAVFFGAWWLFVGSLNAAEIIVGAIGAALAVVASHLVGAGLGARFFGHARWFAQVWRLPWSILKETVTLLGALARQLAGVSAAGSHFREVPYLACGEDDASRTERALATALPTVSPNFIVVGIDTKRRRLLFHQVVPTALPKMLRSLGARP